MVVIETATKDDVLRLLEIEREAISPPWSQDSLLSEICNGDTFFVTARFQGVIVGFAVLRKMGDDGELLQIDVGKDARRSGVADALMTDVMQYAKDSGLKAVFLEVRESNAAAIALYKKHGADVVHSRKSYYNEPIEDALIMRLS